MAEEKRNGSIRDVTNELKETNEMNLMFAEDSNVQLNTVNENLTMIAEGIMMTYDVLRGNKLLEEENRRELLRLLAGLKGDGGDDKDNNNNNNQQSSSVLGELGLAAGIAALAGLLTGAVLGYIKGVIKTIDKLFIKPFRDFFGGLFKRIGKALKLDVAYGILKNGFLEIIEDIKVRSYVAFDDGIRKPVVEFFTKIKTRFLKLIEPVTKAFDDIRASLTGENSLFTKIKDFFSGLIDKDAEAAIDSVKKTVMSPIEKIKKFFSGDSGLLKPITGFFDDLIPFFDKFKALGKSVGRIFAPLGVILSIFDGVSEAEEAAGKIDEEGGFLKKLLAGVTGFIGGVIDGAIFQLTDLIKDGLAWVAGKLGFSNVEAKLNNFSFSKEFNKILDKVYEFINSPIEMIKEGIEKAKSAVSDVMSFDFGKIGDFMKELLRAILPDPSKKRTLLDPAFYAVKAIPDAIYEYAGINPDTGELIEATKEGNLSGAQIKELAAAAQEAGMDLSDVQNRLAAGQQVMIPNFGTAQRSDSGGIQIVPIEAQSTPRGRDLDSIADGNLNIGGA